MMALGTGTFGVHSLGHRTPFGAINQRGTWEMGNTDRLLADGRCRREYKSSSEEPPPLPHGGRDWQAEGGPGPWRVHQMCVYVWGQQQAFGGGEMQVDTQKEQTCFITYAEFITCTNLSLKYTSVFTRTLTVAYSMHTAECIAFPELVTDKKCTQLNYSSVMTTLGVTDMVMDVTMLIYLV